MQQQNSFLCVAAALIGIGQIAASQPAIPTPQQQAEAALRTGNPAVAVELSRDILRTDPDNFAGTFLLAIALNETGMYTRAARTAARAYRAAPTESDRLNAAQLAGLSWFEAGAFTRSEVWLRIAANHIQTEEEARAVVLDFERSREANPLSIRLGGSIAPSDNVNNGAEDEAFMLEGVPFEFTLPPERRALSGIEYSAEGEVTYRLSQNETQRTSLGAYLFGRTFSLSDEAKGILPDANGSDFALVIGDISVLHDRQILSLGPSSIGANVGRIWFGGDPVWNYRSVTLQQAIILDGTSSLTLRTSGTVQMPVEADINDVTITDVGAAFNTRFANSDTLQVAYKQTRSDGGFENIFDEYQITTNYGIAQPLFGTLLSLTASLGYRDYDTFPTTLDGRRDTFASAGVNVVFQDLSYFGFSPLVSISSNRTTSSAEEFNSRGVQARIGLQSNF